MMRKSEKRIRLIGDAIEALYRKWQHQLSAHCQLSGATYTPAAGPSAELIVLPWKWSVGGISE